MTRWLVALALCATCGCGDSDDAAEDTTGAETTDGTDQGDSTDGGGTDTTDDAGAETTDGGDDDGGDTTDTTDGDAEEPPACEPTTTICVAGDVWLCQADGSEYVFAKACEEGTQCLDLRSDGSGGECACIPQCDDKECGDDSCGGLCNGCLDLVHDDGQSDTAFGYFDDPGFSPTRVGCFVRFELPGAGMKLTRFSAGWLTGLVQLAAPFDLVYVPLSAAGCEAGEPDDWYKEFCSFGQPIPVVVAENLLPKGDYAAHETDELGDVTLPEKSVLIGAVFDIDEYPVLPCPVDTDSPGTDSFMLPEYDFNGEPTFRGAAFDNNEEDKGAISLRIRVTLE